ncbi:ATP-binding protein [Nocardia aurea]|uniref:ATP-binding protein n=1 Tax=Nocardia aurea TaxID=2144174 RepID=A0ABV3G1L9_9NOCA
MSQHVAAFSADAAPSSTDRRPSFARLDGLLEHALAALEPGDPFTGLYLTPAQADRALSVAAANPVALPRDPSWENIRAGEQPWDWLRASYRLTEFELDVVLVALAPELDLRYERVLGYLNDDLARPWPTVDLLLRLLSADRDERVSRRACFAPGAALLRHRVIELVPDRHSSNLLAHGVRLDQQITDMLLCQGGLDRRLTACASLTRPEPVPLPDELVRHRDGVLYFHGPPETGRRAAAAALAAYLDKPLLEFRPADASVELVPTVLREQRLHAAVLLVDLDTEPAVAAALTEQIGGTTELTVLTGTRTWPPTPGAPTDVHVVTFDAPDYRARREAWGRAVPGADPDALDALAGLFRLTAARIGAAAATARAQHENPTRAELFAAARAHSRGGLTALAQHIEPRYGWDDLVLPTADADDLRALCLRVTHRDRVLGDWGFTAPGRGVTALFAGPSGTGKTMAAEVIARELGIALYKIDLSTVVSKYIGETEKNLERVFTTAREANACLLFDEADALFGKRSAVRDAHDRYANLEISYLLQRMEHHDGLSILTTNLRAHLDEAFVRRLHFVVEFGLPAEEDRRRIWQRRLPVRVPRDPDIDLDLLAREFPLPGGNIGNIVVAAAFLAAAADTSLGMEHLLTAVRAEYRKMGKVIPAHHDSGST